MPLSRQARIITLLVIDTNFFFLELIVGYAVGSLALVADSFHMLNDVLSLIVALYTIKLATSPSSASNSYGWQRAEILGALINGVFLIALCMSIGLEALGRMISPPEISQPKLIVAVGSAGLLSNIVGLFLFHDHGHGGHSHDHGDAHVGEIALPVGPDEPLNSSIEPTQPKPVARRRSDSITSLPYQHPAETRAQIIESARLGQSIEDGTFAARSPPTHHRMPSSASRKSKPSRPRPQPKAPTPGTNETHPPSREVVTPSDDTAVDDADGPAIPKAKKHDHDHSHSHAHSSDEAERGHNHDSKENGAGGHSHGSMNMHGVFLHVLGDALGNIGVISAGLVIWFCEGRWTLYFDPAVSLLITCIIFSSAMPLVKSTSKILLQGVPNHVSLEAVRASLKEVPGVVSVHELHVWQLSETTTVASVHVLILPDSDYMVVANNIREIMHSQGIHSVTIQPEFVNGTPNDSDYEDDSDERTCLIRCPPDQCVADTCCPPPTVARLEHVAEGDENSTRSAKSTKSVKSVKSTHSSPSHSH